MKKIVLLFVSLLFFELNYAQCSFQFDNSSFLSTCVEQLPRTLVGNPAGGTFTGEGIVSGTTFNPTAGAGAYDITYSVNGCDITETITVDAASLTAEIDPLNSVFFCTNDIDTVFLTGNLGVAGTFLINNTAVDFFVPNSWGEGTHEVSYTYIDPTNGCVSNTSLFLNVSPPESMFFEMPTTFCVGDEPYTLPVLGGIDDKFSGVGVNSLNNFDPAEAGVGTHVITHSYCDFSNVCCDSFAVTVEVVDFDVVTIQPVAPSCVNTNDTFIATFLGDEVQYEWTVEDGTIADYRGDTIVVAWNSAGEKEVTLTVSNSTCSPPPITQTMSKLGVDIAILADDPLIIQGEELTLETEVTISGTGGVGYNWSPASRLSCTNCPNPIASPIETTTYVVTATPNNGCEEATDTVTVRVDIDRSVFVPNIFTPNDDGQNDYLIATSKNIESINMQVFDRFGAKIFQTQNIGDWWDGRYNNRPVGTGVYIYFMDVTFQDGSQRQFNGHVTLVR